jgi:hypothetical protein
MSQEKPVLFREGELPPLVNPQHPLAGLEQQVLLRWLEASDRLNRAYRRNPKNRHDLETAARWAVWEAFAQELNLRSQGLTIEQAMEQTRPTMWTPPTWPFRNPKPTPSRAGTP